MKIKFLFVIIFLVVSTTYSNAQALDLVKDLSNFTFDAGKAKTIINASGETYVVSTSINGNCTATPNGFLDYVAKFDVNRNCQWFLPITITPTNNRLTYTNLILDNAGNLILNAYIYHTVSTTVTYSVNAGSTTLNFPAVTDIYTSLGIILKITPTGTVSWGKTYYENATVASPTGYNIFNSITSDASNNIYLAGTFPNLIYDGALRTNASHGDLILTKINSSGNFTSLVAQSTAAGGGYLSSPTVLFNPSSSRIFLVSTGQTNSGTSGGFAFSNGATVSNATTTNFGLYFASLNTSMSVLSQVFYNTADWAFINNSQSDIVNSGDSIILVVKQQPTTGSMTIGSTTITGDPNFNKLHILKLNASTPSSVAWVKQFTVGYSNDECFLERGQGDNVYLTSNAFSNIDFGNSIQLGYSANTTTAFLLQFKASTGASDWAIKIPQVSAGYASIPKINYSTFSSNLFLHIPYSNIDGIPYDFSVYSLNKKLNVTSVAAASNLCPGSTFTATFSSTQTPSTGNVYTLQLSNEEGQFAPPLNIGTLNSTALTGTITGTIPANIEGSPYMKVRVVASNPALIGAESKTYVNVSTPNNINVINTINYSRTSVVCDC